MLTLSLEWKVDKQKRKVAESTLALAESGYVVLPGPFVNQQFFCTSIKY